MICDWCGKTYEKTLQNSKDFHMLKNYVHKPIVCKDCYKLVRKQKIAKSKAKKDQSIIC